MSSAAPERTLFDQLGGEAGIAKLVEDFYDRVLADPQLKPFFENASMDRLRTMQREFFAAALDGPPKYSGLEISHVHWGRGINKEHFGRFIDRLLDTLKDSRLNDRTVDAIIDRLNMYSDEVTGSGADSE